MQILIDNVLPAIVPLFFIMALGYLIGRKTNYDLTFATDVTVYFTLPTLIFSALAHKWDTPFLAREFLITGDVSREGGPKSRRSDHHQGRSVFESRSAS